MRKDKFARKTHAQKAEFFARMNHVIYFLDLFDALDALGDRAPADVLAAAKRIAAAKGWLRPAGCLATAASSPPSPRRGRHAAARRRRPACVAAARPIPPRARPSRRSPTS